MNSFYKEMAIVGLFWLACSLLIFIINVRVLASRYDASTRHVLWVVWAVFTVAVVIFEVMWGLGAAGIQI